MRYHTEVPEEYEQVYGEVYSCDHPVYNKCTLFKEDNKGLAIIQQRYMKHVKRTFWSDIDPWLANELYLHPGFKEFFNARAKEPVDGLYPTVAIRQIMWALRMKPLQRERWETCFDRKDI